MNKKYIYTWTWIDKDGSPCGWNDCQADNIKEARAIAKSMESPVKEIFYNVIINGRSVRTSEMTKGMFADMKSFKKVSVEKHFEMHAMADRLAR